MIIARNRHKVGEDSLLSFINIPVLIHIYLSIFIYVYVSGSDIFDIK